MPKISKKARIAELEDQVARLKGRIKFREKTIQFQSAQLNAAFQDRRNLRSQVWDLSEKLADVQQSGRLSAQDPQTQSVPRG